MRSWRRSSPTARTRSSLVRRLLAGLALGLALAPAVAAAAPRPGTGGETAAASADVLAAEEKISDERRTTYWAHPNSREGIRPEPSLSSQPFAKLRPATELGALEVYLVLRRGTDTEGRNWLQVRVPMRPNGRVGWVPEEALGDLNLTHTSLTITLRKLRATLYRNGRRVWSAPVGIGRGGTVTPRGRFYVRERLQLGGGGGVYGTFAFGISAYSPTLSDWPGGGVVGIHGTNQPGLIPGRISHGCVRVRNAAINRLRRLMGLGTPIWIR